MTLQAARGELQADDGGLLLEHAHYWMIAAQNGPASPGTCNVCGETRDFVNGFTRRFQAPTGARRFGRQPAAPSA